MSIPQAFGFLICISILSFILIKFNRL